MRLHRTQHPPTCDKDISSKRFWASSFAEREETFRWLRENAPVSWHPPIEDPAVPASVHGEAGFWALTRAEDISFASQHYAQFSSELGLPYLRPRDPAFPGLAPTMLRVALSTLFHRIPGLRVAVAPSELDVRTGSVTGGLVSLPVTW